jgi:two-component system chemotaxis response regulator CheB
VNSRKIRVLIVDDSAIVRRVLSGMLWGHPDIEVVATAPDPYVARDKILELKPDVLTLDIEMPRMDGLSFLERLMRFHPLPVIVISSIAPEGCRVAMEALRLGAVEVLGKPGGPYTVEDLGPQVVQAVRAAGRASVRARRGLEDTRENTATETARVSLPPRPNSSPAVVVIGASTGGVEAIHEVLVRLPASFPPILVVQHIPRPFSAALAEHLNRTCALEVQEAQEVSELLPGRVLIAPGDRHMELRSVGAKRSLFLNTDPPVNRHRPSVDVLFHSAARAGADSTVGVLLTGMGADGAEGLLALRRAGASTIAQDEQSSVVYGMPAEAVRLGAAEVVLPLKDIAAGIARLLSRGAVRQPTRV